MTAAGLGQKSHACAFNPVNFTFHQIASKLDDQQRETSMPDKQSIWWKTPFRPLWCLIHNTDRIVFSGIQKEYTLTGIRQSGSRRGEQLS
jgi:hypothetical protein